MNTDICKKCKKEYDEWRSSYIYRNGLCFECDKKREFREVCFNVGIVLGVILLIIGIRILWAKVVYNDMRCVLAECRILK